MGKFNAAGGTVIKALSDLEEQALAPIPTGQPEAAPEAPVGQPIGQAPATPTPGVDADLQAATDAGIEEGAAIQAEEDRQTIPSLPERAADTTTVQRWKPGSTPKPVVANASISPDGQLRARARAMNDAAVEGGLALNLSRRNTAAFKTVDQEGGTQQEGAEAIAQEKEGSLIAAVHRSGAVEESADGRNIPNQMYNWVASAVVENTLSDLAFGEDQYGGATDPVAQALGDVDEEGVQPAGVPQEEGALPRFAKSQGNARMGQQIHAEYQRTQGVKVPEKLPQKEAEVLGDAYKELWVAQNPDLVSRFVDPVSRQAYYQLTSEGQKQFENGATERKRLFPKVQVRPAKTPLASGKLPGDVGQTATKSASGRVGQAQFGNVIKTAVKNMATVPNVVDTQRAKILLSTILPVLASADHETWQAEINNFGPSKVKKYAAAQKDQQRRRNEAEFSGEAFTEETYDPLATMEALTDKIAQEVRSVAQERNGANYLTYGVQAFNGRMAPQQTFFNPTSSKAVRFVTRNAVPAMAHPGSRINTNLRQMYAMMLVKGADAKLPPGREIALKAASPQLEAWGNRLNDALVMTDAEYEAISEAIAQGMALTDPNFPQVPGLDLDPEADAELIAAISSKGEDGPHFIDGLMDYAKYSAANKAGKPYASYFNAYIDGKTNGLASNGIQMGHMGTAEATGVVRKNVNQLLDKGDIRDQLKHLGLESLRTGWDGETSGIESELNDVATAIFNYRQLNKDTTMTFGYGKEIRSFAKNIEDTLGLLQEEIAEGDTFHSSLAAVEAKMSRSELSEMILNQKYEPALRQVLSDDAIDNRALMRGSAMLHAATNSLFSIKSYTGLDLNLGRDMSTGADGASESEYSISDSQGNKKRTKTFHYESEATSAAPRTMGDKTVPGEYAYGGSLPGPVQSLDAATVAMTASGKSWDKLKAKSGGNPYLHTIYDAFKMDAAGYDTVLEEVNKNWLEATMEWSYLAETQKSTKESMTKFRDDINKRIAQSPEEKLTENEALYMNYMLEMIKTSSGKKQMGNFVNKIAKIVPYKGTDKEVRARVYEDAALMQQAMANVGFDVANPPAVPNVLQLKTFVFKMAAIMDLNSRLTHAVSKTNANKKKLKREILKRGHKTESGESIALQYYAH